MIDLTRSATIAAGLGGALWTAKVLAIIAVDGSAGVFEEVTFLGGLLAIVVATVLVAAVLARRFHGVARVALTVAGAVALFAATVLLESVGHTAVAALGDGTNQGVEEEGGILACGLAWMAVAATSLRARRTPVPA